MGQNYCPRCWIDIESNKASYNIARTFLSRTDYEPGMTRGHTGSREHRAYILVFESDDDGTRVRRANGRLRIVFVSEMSMMFIVLGIYGYCRLDRVCKTAWASIHTIFYIGRLCISQYARTDWPPRQEKNRTLRTLEFVNAQNAAFSPHLYMCVACELRWRK